MQETIEKNVLRVEITRVSRTGMMLGYSPALRGLYVHGRSVEEMEERIPLAIRDILEGQGRRGVEIRKLADHGTDDQTVVFTVRRYELVFRSTVVVH